MKIINTNLIKVRAVEDHGLEATLYTFTLTFEANVMVDKSAMSLDANLARMQAIETGVELLEKELEKHVAPTC